MKTYLLLFACLMVISSPSTNAQFNDVTRDVTKKGTVAAQFLTIPVGARATGMGNAVSAQIDDATSIYWNPAGLTGVKQTGATFESAKWLNEINFNFGALTIPMAGGTFGLGVTSLRTPDMEVRTVEQPDGTGETFNASSMAISGSYARKLTTNFSLGGTIKLVSERIWHSNASAVAFDIGTMYTTPFQGIRLGASISNFGTKLKLEGDDLLTITDIDPANSGNNNSTRATLNTDRFDLPLTMRIGLAGEAVKTKNARITFAVDALSPNNNKQYLNVGTEIGLLGDLVMLRAGYNELLLKDSIRSFTAGAGLRYRFGNVNLGVDYAYENYKYFAAVNRFTMSVKL